MKIHFAPFAKRSFRHLRYFPFENNVREAVHLEVFHVCAILMRVRAPVVISPLRSYLLLNSNELHLDNLGHISLEPFDVRRTYT